MLVEEGAGGEEEVLGRLEGLLAGGAGLPLEPGEIDALIAQAKTPSSEPRNVASFVQSKLCTCCVSNYSYLTPIWQM